MLLWEEVLNYRAKNDMSMESFAKKAGITKQTLISIEKYQRQPTRLTERKIRLAMEEDNKEN